MRKKLEEYPLKSDTIDLRPQVVFLVTISPRPGVNDADYIQSPENNDSETTEGKQIENNAEQVLKQCNLKDGAAMQNDEECGDHS